MKLYFLNKFNFLCICLMFFIFYSSSIRSETITEVKTLDFGVIVLKNNNANYVMNMTFSGNITADPEIIIIESGHPAEYDLSDFPPNTQLTIDIIAPDTETNLAGAIDPSTSQFTITNYHTSSSIITTDALGNATISVGATLTSSGTGFYKDAIYFSYITIMVSY